MWSPHAARMIWSQVCRSKCVTSNLAIESPHKCLERPPVIRYKFPCSACIPVGGSVVDAVVLSAELSVLANYNFMRTIHKYVRIAIRDDASANWLEPSVPLSMLSSDWDNTVLFIIDLKGKTLHLQLLNVLKCDPSQFELYTGQQPWTVAEMETGLSEQPVSYLTLFMLFVSVHIVPTWVPAGDRLARSHSSSSGQACRYT